MLTYPMTKEEAYAYRYDQWSGNPKGVAYVPHRCAFGIVVDYHEHQCGNLNGKGPAGLYCGTHANLIARRTAK